MMEASNVGLHIMWPSRTDTAAAGIEPGRRVPEYHGLAFGGRHLGHNHSAMMSTCAKTTPIVRKPQPTSCTKSICRKSGKPLSAIAPPGSKANSNTRVVRATIAINTLTIGFLAGSFRLV